MPLADRHFDLEAELDSDPEVLRFLYGRARSRAEVAKSHTQRVTLSRKVDGLGYWIAFGTDGGQRGSIAPEGEEDGEFVGLMMLPPAHGPDQPDDPNVAAPFASSSGRECAPQRAVRAPTISSIR